MKIGFASLLIMLFNVSFSQTGSKLVLLKLEKYNFLEKEYSTIDNMDSARADFKLGNFLSELDSISQRKGEYLLWDRKHNDYTYNFFNYQPLFSKNGIDWKIILKDTGPIGGYNIYSANFGDDKILMVTKMPYRSFYLCSNNDFGNTVDTVLIRMILFEKEKLNENNSVVNTTRFYDPLNSDGYAIFFKNEVVIENVTYQINTVEKYNTNDFEGYSFTASKAQEKVKLVLGTSKLSNSKKLHLSFISADQNFHYNGELQLNKNSTQTFNLREASLIKDQIMSVKKEDFENEIKLYKEQLIQTNLQRQNGILYADRNKESANSSLPVSKPAEFPGGIQGWTKFLERNMNRDIPVERKAPPGKYVVVVSFIVDAYGNVTDVMAENDPGYGSKEEAVRVLRISPKWVPASLNGNSVVSERIRQSVSFVVSEE